MASHNHDEKDDILDSLETLDNLEAIDVETVELETITLETGDLKAMDVVERGETHTEVPDEPASESHAETREEEVILVHSHELIEPLEAADIVDLDYDDDEPTRVDGRLRQQRRESFPPPHRTMDDDANDVYLLTEERRPSLRPAPLPKVIPPPRRDTIPPAEPRQAEMSSIAPVAMTPVPEHREAPTARPGSPRRVYGPLVAALAAAAAMIALWPADSAEPAAAVDVPAEPPAAAVVNTAEVEIRATEPVVHKLGVVEIVGTEPKPAADGEVAVPVAPSAANPSTEVVIDDRAQLTGDVVFPHGPMTEPASSEPESTEPEASEPAAAEPAEKTAEQDTESAEIT
ncbi:MAG: hypothetical protein ACOC1F_09840, partial [Myxococcota bacterium]